MDAHISDPKESAHRLCRLLSVNKGEREKHENDVYKHVHKSGSSRRLCVPCCTRLFALHKNYSILVFVRVAQIKWKNGNAERATKAPCIHIKGFPQDESTSADTFLSSRLEGNNKGRCWFKRQFSKTVRSLRQSKPIRFSFLRGAGHFRVSLWSKETLAASSRGRCELIERKNREMDTPSPHVGQPPKQREQGLRAVHAREPPVRQLSTATGVEKKGADGDNGAHGQPASQLRRTRAPASRLSGRSSSHGGHARVAQCTPPADAARFCQVERLAAQEARPRTPAAGLAREEQRQGHAHRFLPAVVTAGAPRREARI